MDDHVEAIAILRRGLISNPGDPLLLNNLAYSSACTRELPVHGEFQFGLSAVVFDRA